MGTCHNITYRYHQNIRGVSADRFTVEALNKDGKKLNAEISRLTSVMVQISISDEQYHITIGFKYE